MVGEIGGVILLFAGCFVRGMQLDNIAKVAILLILAFLMLALGGLGFAVGSQCMTVINSASIPLLIGGLIVGRFGIKMALSKGKTINWISLVVLSIVVILFLVIVLISSVGSGCHVGQDPLTVMAQDLNKVKAGGQVFTSTQVVQFSEGEKYDSDAVAREAGIELERVEFCCQGANNLEGKCEGYYFDSYEQFSCTPKIVIVEQGISGKIRGYCSVEGHCIVGFKVSR